MDIETTAAKWTKIHKARFENSQLVEQCLQFVLEAPEQEDSGDYVMEAIELSERLQKAFDGQSLTQFLNNL